MPLIAKNQVVVKNNVEKQPQRKVEAEVIDSKPKVEAKTVIASQKEMNPNKTVKKGVSLTVDGKERKVSKNSTYLLDMLTLDDQ